MIGAREVSYAIYGAWRLARFDANGLQCFDNSLEAFWRSFCAAAVALPFYALLVTMRLADAPITAGTPTVILVESIAYVAGWAAFPLAMHYVARMLDRGHNYFRYMAAYNWSVVLQVTLLFFVTAATASGILPDGAAALLSLAAMLAIFAYQWFIARAGLPATPAGAAGVVALDLALGIVINGWATRILMAGALQAG